MNEDEILRQAEAIQRRKADEYAEKCASRSLRYHRAAQSKLQAELHRILGQTITEDQVDEIISAVWEYGDCW